MGALGAPNNCPEIHFLLWGYTNGAHAHAHVKGSQVSVVERAGLHLPAPAMSRFSPVVSRKSAVVPQSGVAGVCQWVRRVPYPWSQTVATARSRKSAQSRIICLRPARYWALL